MHISNPNEFSPTYPATKGSQEAMKGQEGQEEISFGIICNGTVFQAWQADSIHQLLALEKVSCGLLIIAKDPPAGRKKPKHLCWYLYKRLSARFARSLSQVDMTRDLENIPAIYNEPDSGADSSGYFSALAVEKIREAGLKFILNFGSANLGGKILEAAAYGIWTIHHDDLQTYRGEPQSFWEIFRDDKITGAVLQKLTENEDAGVILRQGYVKTRYSYARNRDQINRETSRWPALLCTDILNGHTEIFQEKPVESNAPVYPLPRNRQLLIFLFKLVYFRLREASRKFFFTDYWNIGVAKAPISAFLGDELPEVDWYPLRSRNRFLADPFGWIDDKDEHKLHIFYETYPFKEARGKLDYILYDRSFGKETKLIKETFHLSYPYPVQYKGDFYLVPESFEANRVFMYRATHFPLSWERSHVLLDGFPGIDNTIIRHEDTYWMFTTDRNDGFRHNLKLFYTDDLLGEWTPHPKNPVKTDIRSARPAGTPFLHEGNWYRPSMDYAEKIEGRIYINKILRLTRTAYEEIPVRIIDPYADNAFSDKIHTLSKAGNYTLVDGGKEAFIFGSIYFMLRGIVLVFHKVRKKLTR
jgi:hypothetical protein